MRNPLATHLLRAASLSAIFLTAACSESSTDYEARQWSATEYFDILEAEKALPADSILIPVLMDYDATRKKLKACNGN